ncbi:hypothetical protein AAZX31_06G223300 [Glycine max]
MLEKGIEIETDQCLLNLHKDHEEARRKNVGVFLYVLAKMFSMVRTLTRMWEHSYV